MAKPTRAGASRSSVLLHSYERTVHWSRLTLAAFFAVFACIMFWSIPWFPSGLSDEDYNSQTSVLLLMLLAAASSAFIAVRLRDQRRRIEQTLLTWTTVQEGLADLRDREYFLDRIMIACGQARAASSEFTVCVVKLAGDNEAPSVRRLRVALESLEPMIDEFDCLASIGDHEIGILASEVTRHEASVFVARLQESVKSALVPEGRLAKAGYAVFGWDSTDAVELMALAHERMQGSVPAALLASSYPTPAA